MTKEHKTLTEFFTFIIDKHDKLQLDDAENIIQDYYKYRAEQAEKLKEEKRLIKLEREAKKKEKQQLQANRYNQKIVEAELPKMKRNKIKSMKEMQALIDRIRN